MLIMEFAQASFEARIATEKRVEKLLQKLNPQWELARLPWLVRKAFVTLPNFTWNDTFARQWDFCRLKKTVQTARRES